MAVLRITGLEANRRLLTKHREVEFGKADDKSRSQGTERDYNKEHLYANLKVLCPLSGLASCIKIGALTFPGCFSAWLVFPSACSPLLYTLL